MNEKWKDKLPKPVAFVLSGGANLGSVQVTVHLPPIVQFARPRATALSRAGMWRCLLNSKSERLGYSRKIITQISAVFLQ